MKKLFIMYGTLIITFILVLFMIGRIYGKDASAINIFKFEADNSRYDVSDTDDRQSNGSGYASYYQNKTEQSVSIDQDAVNRLIAEIEENKSVVGYHLYTPVNVDPGYSAWKILSVTNETGESPSIQGGMYKFEKNGVYTIHVKNYDGSNGYEVTTSYTIPICVE